MTDTPSPPAAAAQQSAAAAAAAAAFLLLVAWNPSGYSAIWSGKTAIMLLAMPVGLALLPALWPARRREVVLAGGFLLVSAFATIASAQPHVSVFGLHAWGTGLLFNGALVSLWALGVFARASSRRLLAAATAGLILTSAVAVLQILLGEDLPVVGSLGRSIGLAGSANHLGALTGALAWLSAWQIRRHLAWCLPIILAAAAAQTSGSRAAVGLALFAAGLPLIQRRWRLGLLALLAVLVGFALGSMAAETGGSVSATGRSRVGGLSAQPGEGGLGVRLEVWDLGASAFLDRPLLGHGPGLFRTATSGRQTLGLARAEGPDVIYVDAHNFVVEHVVATGFIGAFLLLGWLSLAIRQARGPLLLGALALLAANLVNPQSASTTPLAFLLLGAASASGPARRFIADRWLVAAGLGIGATMATVLLVAEWHVDQALTSVDPSYVRTADALLPFSPLPPSVMGALHSVEAFDGHSTRHRNAAVRWWGEAVERDDHNPSLWIAYATALEDINREDEARAAYEEAIRLNPWSVGAMNGLARRAEADGDLRTAARWLRRSLVAHDSQDARRALDRLEMKLGE